MANADFIKELGRPLLAHRLRRAADRILASLSIALPQHGVTAPPTSGSTMLLLRGNGPMAVTEIAARLRFSHPMVIKLAAALTREGLVRDQSDPRDNRRRLIALTDEGRQQADRFAAMFETLGRALEEVYEETGTDLFEAINAFEQALERRPIDQRIGSVADKPAIVR